MGNFFDFLKKYIHNLFFLILAASLFLLAGLAISITLMAEDNHRNNLDKKLAEVSNKIDGQFFSKVKDMAFSIASNPAIVSLCINNGPVDSSRVMAVQDAIKNGVNASIVYVLNSNGTVISSTKITGGKKTLTGENYRFRPYFIKSMQGISQTYAAVGVTTLERGIYFSSPVINPKNKRVVGTAVVKMNLDIIDNVLKGVESNAAIASPEGVIFSSNRKDWLFKSIYPIEMKKQKVIDDSKQFAGLKIEALESKNHFLKNVEYINKIKFDVASYPFYLYGWKIVICEENSKTPGLNGLQKSIVLSLLSSIIAMIGILFLIDINRKTNLELKQYESNYHQVFDAVNDAIFIQDPNDGRILEVNKKAGEMFGFDKKFFINKNTDMINIVEEGYSESKVQDRIEMALQGTPNVFEWRVKSADNRHFWVEVSLKKAEISGNAVVLSVVRDIDERKLTEIKMKELVEDLKRSNSELQEFAYVASHDLKEPLRMVSSYVQLLAKRYSGKLDKDADDFIGYAVSGAKQMQNLIEDLLAYSRVGTKGADFENVDMNILLKRTEDNFKFALSDKKGVLKFGQIPEVFGDLTQIEQLIRNLISNSIKFSRKDISPVIEISAEKQGNMLKFRVADNGIGIEPKYFDRIFVIFQKLHSRDEYEGTGIGLSICKKIVERHGGQIWVESEPGFGTTFYFTLPSVKV
jgi:PAS domain S-box-containing protein